MPAGIWRAKLTSAAIALGALLWPCNAVAEASAHGEAASNASAILLEPTLLEVTLNGRAMPDPALIMRSGSLELFVEEQTLAAWRLRLPVDAHQIQHEGGTWVGINGIDGLETEFSEHEQKLAIKASSEFFSRQWIGAPREVVPMTQGATGAFLNYDAFAEYSHKSVTVSGFFAAGIFTPVGVATSSFAGRTMGGKPQLTRLESNIMIDRPDSMLSLRVGDSIGRGGATAQPIRFAGIQFARNFEVQPGFITFPLPSLEGSAAIPSVAEIYVDSVLRESRSVDSGPFTIGQAPVRTGGGTVQLVTRDLLGREVVTSQNYYSSADLLRSGLHDFAYEAGLLRKDFGVRSFGYGRPVVSAVHRYGLSDRITVEGSARATPRVQNAGAGFSATVFDLAQVTASAGLSRSSAGSGFSAAWGVERRAAGFSFGMRTDYRSRGFHAVGEADHRSIRFTTHAFADVSLPWGSLAFNLYDRRSRQTRAERLIGVSSSLSAWRGGNLHVYARRAVSGSRDTVLGAFLSVALDRNRNSTISLDRSNSRVTTRYSLQQEAPSAGGHGFRASVERGAAQGANLQYLRNVDWGSYSAEVASWRGQKGVRLSASGSLGLLGGEVFAARRLGNSFAQVRVGRHAGVRVYADNRLIGRTGKNGKIILPDLRAYESNPIRIDDADLPMTALASDYEKIVRPYARTGNIVQFDIQSDGGVILQLMLGGRQPLPAGAKVRIEGRNEDYFVSSDGEVFIPELNGTARLTASWESGRCAVVVSVPLSSDPQPRIGGLSCRAELYAQR